MKSKYLISAEDIEVGDEVYIDEEYRKNNEEPCKVKVTWIGQIFARVKNSRGNTWEAMRNRLTKEKRKDIV